MEDVHRLDNPSEKANCFSKLMFWYMNGTFVTGSKRRLDLNDVFQIREEDSSRVLCAQLEEIWDAEVKRKTNRDNGAEPCLFKAVFRMSMHRLFIIGVCLLLHQVICVAQTLFFRELIDLMELDSLKNIKSIYWTVGIAGCLVLQHIVYNFSYFIGLQLGLNVKSAIISMLYKKILQIPEGSVRSITTSHISKLIADSHVFLNGFTLINFIWIAPVVSIIVIVLLWHEIGVPCLGGIGLIVILFPIHIYGHVFIQSSCCIKTGKRESVISEIIRLIEAVKLYRLEHVFEAKIKYLRREEIESSKKCTVASVLSHSVSGVIWLLALLVIFSIIFKVGGVFKVSSVIMTLMLVFILYQAVTSHFLCALQSLRNLQDTVRKIQTFLNSGSFDCSYHTMNTLSGEDIGITFQHATAAWFGGDPSLQHVSFKVNRNNPLVVVVGPPGSGKSSVLLTVLNELRVVSGKVNVNGCVSYAAQNIWLFPGTIKHNILFGNEYERTRYDHVLHCCCLIEDIKSLKFGDSTLIGQAHASIGDEFKAKICIARSAYSYASIYLFDNLFNYIPVETGKKIFDRCIRGFMRKKLVMVVSNQIQYLDHASSILCLNQDGTSNFGSLVELSRRGVDIASLLQQETYEKQWDEDSAIETDSSMTSVDEEQAKSRILGGVSLAPSKSVNSVNHAPHLQRTIEPNSDLLVVTTSDVNYLGLWSYLLNSIGWFSLVLLIFFHLCGQVLMTFTDYWFIIWSHGEQQRLNNGSHTELYFAKKPNFNLYLSIALVSACTIFNILRTLQCHFSMVKSTRKTHDIMVRSLLMAPLSFFQKTSINDILNRFTKDIHVMDAHLPKVSCERVHFILFAFTIIVLNCLNIPVLAAIFIPFMVVLYFFNRYSTRTLRMLRNLETTSQTPMLTHISSTFIGITTIRAHGVRSYKKVLNEFYACQDHHSESSMMLLLGRIWVAQRKSVIVFLVSVLSFVGPLIACHFMELNYATTTLSLVHVFTINILLQWYTWKDHNVEKLMFCAQRLFEFVNLDSEPDIGHSVGLRETWPEIGQITGENASFAYDTVSPNVLRRLFFCIRAKEKVGIVGSPGSGKSSFLLMIYRMAKVSGTVCIDGYPIQDLTLNDLRRTMSIIPEDPIVFTCSIRQNLDPHMHHGDGEIWEALDDVQMKEVVMDYPDKLDTVLNMSKYSIQERKLFCLARVILEGRKILVIDGAVPSSDNRTERIIQRTIRDKFKESTVIFIAYRLNTIMDLDRIMVMNCGKIVEFDEPFQLLQNPNGHFRKLVDQAGKSEAARLEVLADEARKLRQVILLQSQVSYPGSNFTSSKSKSEILKHFGSRVIFETTL